jgi:hypothetical protein
MQIHVFLGIGWQGFTADPSAANLPADKGPWRPFKIIDMNRGEHPQIAVNTDAVLDAIERDGFFLQASQAGQADA